MTAVDTQSSTGGQKKGSVDDNRSENEKMVFQAITDKNAEKLSSLLKDKSINVNAVDDQGMTALQQAAFQRQREACELLLAHGADVNHNKHEHGYTALMFAALSGNKDVTRLMLEHGAKVGHTNSVSRTAAQMAAFTGQHEVVSLINNFFSRDDLDYYTVPHDLEKEARLPAELAGPLHKLLLNNNLHPVKISLLLRTSSVLIDGSNKVWRHLAFMCEKQMKQRETNEILAMKFHYLGELVRHMEQWCSGKQDPKLEQWIKYLVRGRDSDGFPERQEQMVRSIIKGFPYQGQLLLQIVRSISPVKVGDAPHAVAVLTQHINGQHMPGENEVECDACGDLFANKKCSKCKVANYCQLDCQKFHWPTHKKLCNQMNEQRLCMEAAQAEAEAQRKLEEQAEQSEQASIEPTVAQTEAEEEPRQADEGGESTHAEKGGESKLADSCTDAKQFVDAEEGDS